VGGACSTHEGDEKCVQKFGWETWVEGKFGGPRLRWEDTIKMGLMLVNNEC
jgi:hypothetical protein